MSDQTLSSSAPVSNEASSATTVQSVSNTSENRQVNTESLSMSQDDVSRFWMPQAWPDQIIYNEYVWDQVNKNPEEAIQWMTYEQSVEYLNANKNPDTKQIDISTPDTFINNEKEKNMSELNQKIAELEALLSKGANQEPPVDTQSTDTIIEDKEEWNKPDENKENDPLKDYVVLPYSEDEIKEAIQFKQMYWDDLNQIISEKKKIIDYAMKQQEIDILKDQIRDLNQQKINLEHNSMQINDPLEMSIVNSMKSYKEDKSENSQYAVLTALNNALIRSTGWAINITNIVDDYFAKQLWVRWGLEYQPRVTWSFHQTLDVDDISKYWLKL